MNIDKNYSLSIAICFVIIGLLSPLGKTVNIVVFIIGLIFGLYTLWVYSIEFDQRKKDEENFNGDCITSVLWLSKRVYSFWHISIDNL